MNKTALNEVMELAEAWLDPDQQELLTCALEIEVHQNGSRCDATAEELEGIERGLQEAREGRFATNEEAEPVFAQYRGR